MSTVRVTWIDSISAGVLGNKILRNEVEIADIGMGIETYDDATADPGVQYKYTVQAYDNNTQTTIEVPGVNSELITTTAPQAITMVTTSSSSIWQPRNVSNTGDTLVWTATNPLIGTLQQTADEPIFDFSPNDGSPIDITITNGDAFAGLNRLEGYTLNITELVINNAVNMGSISFQNNQITELQINSLPLLTNVRMDTNLLATLDVSNNPLVESLQINDNLLPSNILDAIINAFDAGGISNGLCNIALNAGSLSSASQPAYDNLVAKGWDIDVPAPGSYGIGAMTYDNNFLQPPLPNTDAVVLDVANNLSWFIAAGGIGYGYTYNPADISSWIDDANNSGTAMLTQIPNWNWSVIGDACIFTYNDNRIFQYMFGNNFEWASWGSRSDVTLAEVSEMRACRVSPDGTKVWVADRILQTIYEYDLPTPYRIAGIVYSGNSFATSITTCDALEISPDGRTMLLGNSDSNEITQYDLPNAFTITGATEIVTVSVNAELNIPYGIRYNAPDNDKIFIMANANNAAFQYSLNI